jgi:5-methylcytosine-specific restriction endonuclease McrA
VAAEFFSEQITINLVVTNCFNCGLNFKFGDLIEIDHINPKSRGGMNNYENIPALHRHCHDEKTANDGSNGIPDKEPSHSGAG